MGTLLAFAGSLVAAGTAAAASERFYVVEGTEIGSTPFEAEGSSSTSKIEGVFGGTKAIVRCSKDAYSGKNEETGKSKGSIELKECKLFSEKESSELKTCKVTEPIVAKFKGQVIGKEEKEEEPVELKLSPEATEFTKIEITEKEKEKCSEAGKTSLTGSQTCKLPSGEEEKTEHEIECASSGSGNLKLGSEKASLTNSEKVKLQGGHTYASVEQPQPRTAYEWLFNNAALTETKELNEIGAIGKFKIKGVARSTDFLVECNTVESTSAPKIVNGLPGKVSSLTFKFKGCSVVEPSNCTITEPITTEPLEGELGLGVGTSRNKFVIAIASALNQFKFFTLTFNGAACSLKTAPVNAVRGFLSASTLAEISNEQLLTHTIKFEPTQNLNYRSIAGNLFGSGLKVEGETTNRISLIGEVALHLTGGGEWGPN